MSSGVPASSQAAPPTPQVAVSAGVLWTGRILSALLVLFLLCLHLRERRLRVLIPLRG